MQGILCGTYRGFSQHAIKLQLTASDAYICVCIIFNTYIIKLYYSIISPFLCLALSLRRDFANETAIP
jgi:hypothetical protein